MKQHKKLISLLVASAWLVQGAGFAVVPALADDPGRFHVSLNGDGPADLVVGVPFENVGAVVDAGAINVIYGAVDAGLVAAGNRIWDQAIAGMDSPAETSDTFGKALAIGNFNGDAYADVAVGVPGEGVGAINGAGAVHILYGSASGITVTGDQWWNQDSPNIEGGAEANDAFGSSLAAADFNRDGYTDLAVGVPSEEVSGQGSAGAVNVLYGSSGGLSAANDRMFHQDSALITDSAEAGDQFGRALAAGDFDGNGYADLAIGVPNENYAAGHTDDGAVHVLYGSSGGLTATGSDIWNQDLGLDDAAEDWDYFGYALATGDFDGDGYSDLAVGVYGENIGSPTIFDAGAVNVIYGSAGGLTTSGDQFWHQDIANVQDTAEDFDDFGMALTTGDFNGDGFADLAVGVPYEDIVAPADAAGAVNVIYGSVNGLSATAVPDQFWNQGSSGLGTTAEVGDEFGYALTAGDFNQDGFADLVVGAPYEDVVNVDVGLISVIRGSANRLTSTGSQVWYQSHSGLDGAAEASDRFGYALAASGALLELYMPDLTNQ